MSNIDLTQVVEGITLSKVCSIKPDKESTEHKSINLNIKFDGVTLNDVFAKAVSSAVIQWQNGQGRNKYDRWIDGQTVNIEFKAPARTTIDPEQAMIAKLQSMTPEEQSRYLAELAKKATK